MPVKRKTGNTKIEMLKNWTTVESRSRETKIGLKNRVGQKKCVKWQCSTEGEKQLLSGRRMFEKSWDLKNAILLFYYSRTTTAVGKFADTHKAKIPVMIGFGLPLFMCRKKLSKFHILLAYKNRWVSRNALRENPAYVLVEVLNYGYAALGQKENPANRCSSIIHSWLIL